MTSGRNAGTRRDQVMNRLKGWKEPARQKFGTGDVISFKAVSKRVQEKRRDIKRSKN